MDLSVVIDKSLDGCLEDSARDEVFRCKRLVPLVIEEPCDATHSVHRQVGTLILCHIALQERAEIVNHQLM